MYASDAGNYRMVPIGVVLPRDADDVVHTVAVCRRHGAPIVARGGGTGIPGQTVNAAVVLDFSKYMNRIVAIDPEQRYARVEPGIVLDELRKAAGQARSDVRPRSRDAQPQHARRHDRQQFVRHPLDDGRRDGRTTSNELDIVLYDGTRMTVGADQRRRPATASSARADARGDLSPAAAICATGTRTESAREFPMIPRRVSGFNLPALAAGARLRRRQGAGRHGRHVRARPRGQDDAGLQPAGALAAGLRVSPTSSPPPTTSSNRASSIRSGSRRSTTPSSTT